MFYLHPIFQVVATILGVYVLSLGWRRVQTRHLGLRAHFFWARHAKLGRQAMLLWLFGILFAMIFIGLKGGLFTLTPHVFVGWAFLPLMFLVFISGRKLEKAGGRKNGLAAAHGLAGLVLVLAALFQCVSGGLMLFGNL